MLVQQLLNKQSLQNIVCEEDYEQAINQGIKKHLQYES